MAQHLHTNSATSESTRFSGGASVLWLKGGGGGASVLWLKGGGASVLWLKGGGCFGSLVEGGVRFSG